MAQWFWRRRILNIFNIVLHFCYYLPLEKGVALYLSKLESPLPKDALCQVWLKLAQWFWRRSWKCEKFTDGQTDGQTTDNRRSEKITWALSSGELKGEISFPKGVKERLPERCYYIPLNKGEKTNFFLIFSFLQAFSSRWYVSLWNMCWIFISIAFFCSVHVQYGLTFHEVLMDYIVERLPFEIAVLGTHDIWTISIDSLSYQRFSFSIWGKDMSGRLWGWSNRYICDATRKHHKHCNHFTIQWLPQHSIYAQVTWTSNSTDS